MLIMPCWELGFDVNPNIFCDLKDDRRLMMRFSLLALEWFNSPCSQSGEVLFYTLNSTVWVMATLALNDTYFPLQIFHS